MATIDWDKLEEEQGSNFKDYAPAGVYKVKVKSIDIKIVGVNGSIAQEFFFEEDENYQYPKATHWISTKNPGWTQIHNRNLMMLLGASKADAQKAVELCEAKADSKANLINAYTATYNRLIAKNPEVEIEVWQDGKYSRGEFTDKSVRMSHPDDDKPAKKDASDDILENAEEITLDQNDDLELPF